MGEKRNGRERSGKEGNGMDFNHIAKHKQPVFIGNAE